jgi:hypothetical protein
MESFVDIDTICLAEVRESGDLEVEPTEVQLTYLGVGE